MRFMMLYTPGTESDAPPTQQEMTDMGQFIEEMAQSGEGESEIRLMHDVPAFDAGSAPEFGNAGNREPARTGTNR